MNNFWTAIVIFAYTFASFKMIYHYLFFTMESDYFKFVDEFVEIRKKSVTMFKFARNLGEAMTISVTLAIYFILLSLTDYNLLTMLIIGIDCVVVVEAFNNRINVYRDILEHYGENVKYENSLIVWLNAVISGVISVTLITLYAIQFIK